MSGEIEHAARALEILDRAMLTDTEVESGYEGEVAAAQVHAVLALVVMLREVRDELAAARRTDSRLARVPGGLR